MCLCIFCASLITTSDINLPTQCGGLLSPALSFAPYLKLCPNWKSFNKARAPDIIFMILNLNEAY